MAKSTNSRRADGGAMSPEELEKSHRSLQGKKGSESIRRRRGKEAPAAEADGDATEENSTPATEEEQGADGEGEDAPAEEENGGTPADIAQTVKDRRDRRDAEDDPEDANALWELSHSRMRTLICSSPLSRKSLLR